MRLGLNEEYRLNGLQLGKFIEHFLNKPGPGWQRRKQHRTRERRRQGQEQGQRRGLGQGRRRQGQPAERTNYEMLGVMTKQMTSQKTCPTRTKYLLRRLDLLHLLFLGSGSVRNGQQCQQKHHNQQLSRHVSK
jgi:hypothetical protein